MIWRRSKNIEDVTAMAAEVEEGVSPGEGAFIQPSDSRKKAAGG
jgi:hypothetical protein